MKKLLVIFAKEFPYGVSEPFLEIECPLYKKFFDKVLIVTNKPRTGSVRGTKTREITEPNIEIAESEFNKNVWAQFRLLFSVFCDVNFYKEALSIIKSRKSITGKIKSLIPDIGKANMCVRLAVKRIRAYEKEGYKVSAAYAYWLLYPAYAAVKLSKKYYSDRLYTVSRAHRFDLYEYRNRNNYLFCRKYILEGLSEIASISEDGREYLKKTYPGYGMNISIQRLGARDVGKMQMISNETPVFRIVSCARTVPVKRIDRIIDTLKDISDINI